MTTMVKHYLSKSQSLLIYPKKDEDSAMLTSSGQLADKFNEAFPRGASRLQDQEIDAACTVSKQAVSGWRDTGRIAKKHLPILAKLSKRDLSWWIPGQDEEPQKNKKKATLVKANAGISQEAKSIIDRLCWMEASGSSSPQLLAAIESILDLVAPNASPDGYPGLKQLRPE